MVLNLDNLYKEHNLQIKGIINIGAHYGREYNEYKKHHIKNIIFIEPDLRSFNVLNMYINKIKGEEDIIFINKALGNFNGRAKMYVETANTGMSNSLLKPKKHLEIYPNISFNETLDVDVVKLDDCGFDMSKYNFINIDVQGYELRVFEGAAKILKDIDYIMSEVNTSELYENGVLINELEDFLKLYNFERTNISASIENMKKGRNWGDAFYIKRK